jgi:CRP-like cAMP-binding protein
MVSKSTRIIDCQECLFRFFVSQYIPKDDFNRLYKNSIQMRYSKGEFIIKQGIVTQHLVFISRGRAKFNYQSDNGRNVILAIASAPGLLGGFNLVNEDRSMFSIVAIEDCEVCLIRMDIIRELISNNSNLALKMVEFVSTIFKDSVFNFIDMAHKQVNGRIAGILLYLAETVYRSNSFTLTLSRRELSEFANCSLENVIHTLSRFNREGIIRLNHKSIVIVDKDKLENISRFG